MSTQLIKLTCPSCGAKLEVSRDSTQFLCAHCGSQYALSQGSGTIEIRSILEHPGDIKSAATTSAQQTSKVALELELSRLERELPQSRKQYGEARRKEAEARGLLAVILGGLIGVVVGATVDWTVGVVVGGIAFLLALALAHRIVIGSEPIHRRLFETEARVAEIKSILEG